LKIHAGVQVAAFVLNVEQSIGFLLSATTTDFIAVTISAGLLLSLLLIATLRPTRSVVRSNHLNTTFVMMQGLMGEACVVDPWMLFWNFLPVDVQKTVIMPGNEHSCQFADIATERWLEIIHHHCRHNGTKCFANTLINCFEDASVLVPLQICVFCAPLASFASEEQN